MSAVIIQRRIEKTVSANKFLTNAARQAYRSFIRAYATHSSESKGIFQVQLLHLGHVAKSFGLIEHITVLRNHEDYISKIMNGMNSAAVLQELNSKENKKLARDKKYSLSGQRNNSDSKNGSHRGGVDHKKDDYRSKNSTSSGLKRSRESGVPLNGIDSENNNASSNKKQKSDTDGAANVIISGERDAGTSKHSIKNRLAQQKASVQKLRMKPSSASGGGSSSGPAPSGRFRKTTGYFRKQLRSQASFEFTAGS
jgi:hypothetical protein